MSVTEKFLSMEYGPAPEDPREALAWLDRHARKLDHFIGGSFRPPAEGVYFDTMDPSTGEPLASVAQGSAADIDAAVEGARHTLPAGRRLTPPPPARCLYSLAPPRGKEPPTRP